jgi:diguanylate cyclase (GGDEF)-like protein
MPSAIPAPGVNDAEAPAELPARRALVPGLAFLAIGLVAGDIVQLAGYTLLAVGLCYVLRGHRRGGQGSALLDAGLLAVSGAVLIGVYVVLPTAASADLSFATLVAAGAHPVGALLCLGLVSAVAKRRSAGTPVPRLVRLLAGTLMVMLVADLVRVVAELHGVPAGTWWMGSLHVLALLGLAAVGIDPARALDEVDPSQPRELSGRHLLVLLAAALLTPAVVAVEATQGRSVPAEIVVLGTVAAVALVALRAGGVLRNLAASRDALAHQTTHDPLTGIANRTLFSRRLTDVLTDGRQCSVVLIDLDEFKQVNDELGHLAGDALLVEVASRLTRAVRVDDLVARFAGDEFAVLLPDITPDEAQRVIDRAAELLNADVVVAGHQMPLRASVGLAHWGASTPEAVAALDQTSDDVDDLLAAADQAMYRDKRQRARHLVLVRSTELVASTPAALLPGLEPTVATRRAVADEAPRLFGGLAGVADS